MFHILQLWNIIMIIMLAAIGTNSQNQRLDQMVTVCGGQDLLHVIARACSIFKRSSSTSQDSPCMIHFIVTIQLLNYIYSTIKLYTEKLRKVET